MKDNITKAEFEQAMKGLTSELNASCVLFPKSAEDKAYNDGLRKAISFVSIYAKGRGLVGQLDNNVTGWFE